MAFGTLFSLDAVAEESQNVATIDENVIWENLDAYFAAHNVLFNMAMQQIGERTTDRLRRFGAVADMVAQELDEFGAPDAQKLAPEGYNVGFPLRKYGNALQWTRFYFENITAEEFTKQVNAVTDADEQALYANLRRAIFRPTNVTVTDRSQTPVIDLPVKALLNADGEPIPTGPSGQTFDGATHTHYLGVTTANTPTDDEITALIEHVIEHFNSGEPRLYIARAQESTVRDHGDFVAYVDARLVDQSNAVVARTGTLNASSLYDRAIGILNGAEVWVRPWIPNNYMLAFVLGPENPLVLREPRNTASQGLRLMAEDERYPLRARTWEHRFGVGVWNRANGAVLDTATGGGNYTAPSV